MTAPVDGVHARLTGVTRTFGLPSGAKLRALGPIDLDIRRGEFFGVVGPSGCGKSTLLDILAGLSPPTDGSVVFEGKPVDGV
ncbi:MAG TPA: ATP-binding cassette domain-containing protein, partial [Xanthobacteraceae bacterium]|nr:ATP-binding cassette domain-containing protein [Xanthobacteraceae bacterium]